MSVTLTRNREEIAADLIPHLKEAAKHLGPVEVREAVGLRAEELDPVGTVVRRASAATGLPLTPSEKVISDMEAGRADPATA
jgi:hypothetical protein